MRLMIDLETWSTTSDAEIIACGLVVFDDKIHISRLFGLHPQKDRIRSQDTVNWWMDRKATLEKIFTAPVQCSLDALLRFISKIIETHQITEVWAKSPSFDLIILDHAYRQAKMEKPWKYSQERDVRTIQAILKNKSHLSDPVCPHDPLSDAVAQTQDVIRFLGMV